MSPYILLVHSKSCLPQGLNHSLRATPRPDRGEGQLLFAEWVRGMQPGPWLEASPVFCFLFFFLGTQSFEWAGDSGCPWEAGTGQVCSQGAHGLASRDPCPPMCSPAPWSVSLQTEWCGDPRRVTLFL